MPYIKADQRAKFDNFVVDCPEFENKGQLEYLIFKIMNRYMRKRTSSYTNLHDVIYAVIHAGEEYRRRYLDLRENCAMEENGDIDV